LNNNRKYCYPVDFGHQLPVDAYIWLKNNQIQYEVKSSGQTLYRCTYWFASQEDASWFALKWS